MIALQCCVDFCHTAVLKLLFKLSRNLTCLYLRFFYEKVFIMTYFISKMRMGQGNKDPSNLKEFCNPGQTYFDVN